MSISAARVYNPTVQKGATYFTLPLPLESTSEELQMRVSAETIPLYSGQLITNVIRGARVMQLSGMMVADSNAELLALKDEIEAFFFDAPATTFHFYRYYDPAHSYYRWFPDCICTGLQFGHTSKTVVHLPYTVGIMCPSGIESVSGTYPEYSGDSGDDTLPAGSLVLYAPLIIDLDSADGSSAVIIRNSNKTPVARIKSNGDIEVTGSVIEASSIT